MSERLDSLRQEDLRRHAIWCFTEDNEAYEPVSCDGAELPTDRGVLFIRASFQSAGGEKFEGTISTDTAYSITIFGPDGEGYSFSRIQGMGELTEIELARMRASGIATAQLFPIHYAAEYHYPGRPLPEGQFNPLPVSEGTSPRIKKGSSPQIVNPERRLCLWRFGCDPFRAATVRVCVKTLTD